MIAPSFRAFTARASGRVLRLTSEVELFPAFAAGSPPTQGRKYIALYDTGATHSAISPRVVQDLSLPSIGARTIGVGGGFIPTTSHLVNVSLPNKVTITMATLAKLTIPSGEDALIGMDILGLGDFAVTHLGGKTVFSFCVPSRKDIDFVAELETLRRSFSGPSGKPAKNALCFCGSGKKYKGCHGRYPR